jgi:hypothetical protein
MRKIFNQKNFNNFVGTPFQILSKIRGDIRSSRLTTGINDTGGKFETALMVYSGAWGKLIHEKNQKQKIL